MKQSQQLGLGSLGLSSEEHRFNCELRWLSKLTLKERREYLMLVDNKRGLEARLKLQEGLEKIWKKNKSTKV